MAHQRELDRVHGIRTLLSWDTAKRAVWIEPDEDDLESAPTEKLLAYLSGVADWSAQFLARHPSWTVNDSGADEDDDYVDEKLALSLQEWTEGETLPQGFAGEES